MCQRLCIEVGKSVCKHQSDREDKMMEWMAAESEKTRLWMESVQANLHKKKPLAIEAAAGDA